MTQGELAGALGVSRHSVNQILNGRRNITADMAVRLEKVVGRRAEYWLGLQMKADLSQARLAVTHQGEGA